ncbi:hypothetical protein ACROYT_G029706 [Oculina patagonica]
MLGDLTDELDGDVIKGIILSAFYYGYIVTPLPGGHLARKLGGATVIGVAVCANGVLTLFTPLAARMHVGMFITLRIAIGLAQGLVFSAGHALWSKWAPPLERSKLGTLNFAGAHLGIIVIMYLSGHLAYHHGWPMIFYVSGISGVTWSLLWLLMVRNSPSEQQWISKEEVEYIELSLAEDLQSEDVPIPWKSIFNSLPVWAITVAHFAHGWGLYTMIAELPIFYIERFNLGLTEASLASTVPFVVTFIVVLLGGLVADCLREYNLCSTGTVRKIFTALGYLFPAVFFTAASYSSISNIVQALITLGMGLNGLAICGYYVNHLDIAPPLASVLLGLTDTAATLAGIVSPTLTGGIVQHHSAEEWRLVFYIMGAIYLVGGTFYVIFASGEKQPWANGNQYDKVPSNELLPDENQEQ